MIRHGVFPGVGFLGWGTFSFGTGKVPHQAGGETVDSKVTDLLQVAPVVKWQNGERNGVS